MYRRLHKNDKKNMELIVKNPKKAINKLSVPIILSNLFMMLNNMIDTIWVAGLGPNAIAGVGFVSPIYVAFIGLANGLGAGANSLIGRCIGAKKYESAENSAIHSIILSIIVTIISTIVMIIILKPLLLIMGAGDVINSSLDYGYVVFGGSFSIFIPAMFAAIFRSQGEIRRASYPFLLSALINMILDPFFIYTLNWGVKGAAATTVIADTLILIPMLYWIVIKKDSYIKIKLKHYKKNLNIYKNILIVGIPASIEHFFTTFTTIVVNYWLTILAGTIAVAAYSATLRLVTVAMCPVTSIGIAALTVGGVAYGAKNYKNFKTTLNYSIKLATIIAIIICILYFIFAEQLSLLFTYSSNSGMLQPKIVEAIKIMCFFIVLMPLGNIAGNLFQSMGKGTTSLILTIIKIFIEIILAGIFAFTFHLNDIGIYIGLVCGISLGSILQYLYILYDIMKHRAYFID